MKLEKWLNNWLGENEKRTKTEAADLLGFGSIQHLNNALNGAIPRPGVIKKISKATDKHVTAIDFY